MSDETGESLPKEAVYLVRSSPPVFTQHSSSDMNDNAESMSEPAVPLDFQQTSRRPSQKRAKSDDTERPASAQRSHDDSEEHPNVEASDEFSSDEDADPAAQVHSYDWDALHKRYHDAIGVCGTKEAELMEEWASLAEFFHVWATSGHAQETDRTFRRLQARTTYVNHEEETLENTRKHYINVVRAFESALNLLKTTGLRV